MVSEEENSTILLELNHSLWHKTAEQIQQTSNKLSATGSADAPETILDGLGKALDKESMMFCSDANKFVITLTDANLKVNNKYGYSDLNSVIEEMNLKNISSSIITKQD